MVRRSFVSLRIRLILVVFMATIAAFGLTLYAGLERRNHDRLRALDGALRLVRIASADQERMIENGRQILFTLSQIPQVQEHNKVACCMVFSNLLRQTPGYTGFVAIKPSGDMFATAPPLTRPVNVADRPWFRRLVQTKSFVIGEYQIGRVSGKTTIILAYPVMDNTGQLKTILTTGLDLERLNQFMAESNLPEGTSLNVIDSDGTILLRHPEPEKFVGKKIPEVAIFKTILAKKEGVAEAIGLDGVPRLYGFTTLGHTPEAIYVSVGIPKKVAFAEANPTMARNIIFLVLMAVLAGLAVWLIGGLFIVQPVNRLLDVTKRLARGDLTVRSGLSNERGEIGQLARAFDQMAESLERRETERKRSEEALRSSEEEAKRLAKENAIVGEIGRIIGSTLNIEEVYDRFTEEVRQLISFDRIAINLIHPEDQTTTVSYAAGMEIEDRRAGDTFPLVGTMTDEVMQTRSSLLIQTEDSEDLVRRFPRLWPSIQAKFKSLLSVPLFSKDEVIGVLHIRSTNSNTYAERDLRLAERIATQIAGAIANTQLFAQLKRTEEALRESEDKFRDLYDHAPVGYHEYDAEGRITNVNRTDLEMLGYTREEMVGQPMWKFNVEEEVAHQQILEKLAGLRPPGQNLERTYRRKDGTTFPVLIEDRLIRDEERRIICIRCTIQDITERKRTEQEMAGLQEQLRQSQKLEAIGRLAGGIAHDFNNLLTVIKGYTQLSSLELEEKESDHLKGNLEEIKKATERATDLIRHLLAFSRRQIMEMKVLDLNALLKNLDKMLRRIIGEDIELVNLLAEDLGRIKIDPGQIEQVIMNLAVNARDAMPEGGKLTIETANVELDEEYSRTHIAVTPGRYVMLSMTDTGVGMTPEVRERVFEPFFTTKEKGNGTGLGLSTAYGIVKQSGGNIWVYSEPGKGTTFKIYLPRVDEPLEEEEKKIVVKEGIPRGDETVLVVEDDEEVRKLAVQMLEKVGYKVLEASQGLDAFLISAEHGGPIHLLLTDLVMPKLDGRELAERIVSIRPEIKVLYMSGYTDNAIVHHGVLEKGTNFIQKPFTVEGLGMKVREVLDKDSNPAV